MRERKIKKKRFSIDGNLEHEKCVNEQSQTPNQHTHLVKHVDRQADHGEIISNEKSFEVNGFPVFHQAGPSPDHTEVDQDNDEHWDRRVHQQPLVRPLIWKIMDTHKGFRTFFNSRPTSTSQRPAADLRYSIFEPNQII